MICGLMHVKRDQIYVFVISCDRFWAANIGARSTSICEVLDALDAWLDAGGIDSHDRPQVIVLLRLFFFSNTVIDSSCVFCPP
eukprot:SAG31_NODE_2998_length_4801_cov_3.226074_3_plen_83_part_00